MPGEQERHRVVRNGARGGQADLAVAAVRWALGRGAKFAASSPAGSAARDVRGFDGDVTARPDAEDARGKQGERQNPWGKQGCQSTDQEPSHDV